MPLNDDKLNIFLQNFLIVGASSSIAKSMTAPLDRIKLILQNQNSALHVVSGKRKKYKSFLDCCIRIPREQGFLSFWRGNGTNIIRYIPNQALNFSFNNLFKNHLIENYGDRLQESTVAFMAGAFAGGSSVTTTYPLKICQTRLSLDMGAPGKDNVEIQRQYTGLSDCLGKIIKTEGIIGMYRGFSLAITTSMIYRSIYFGLFDSLKHIYLGNFNKNYLHEFNNVKAPIWAEFLFAQIVTLTAGLCVYPLDTVGRRIMLDSGLKQELKHFSGPWKAFRIVYINEGISAFYRGACTNCLRGSCGALILVFYDEITHYLNLKRRGT